MRRRQHPPSSRNTGCGGHYPGRRLTPGKKIKVVPIVVVYRPRANDEEIIIIKPAAGRAQQTAAERTRSESSSSVEKKYERAGVSTYYYYYYDKDHACVYNIILLL